MSERTVKMGGVPHPVVGEALQVGAIAPDFKLVDNDLGIKTLADFGNSVTFRESASQPADDQRLDLAQQLNKALAWEKASNL
jgi:hypothetical protein